MSFDATRLREPRRAIDPTLANYAWAVLDGRRIVAASVGVAIVLALAYLFVATPSYVSTSVVQIEQRRRTLAALEDLAAAQGEAPPSEPEIEVIRSRMLLGTVVDQLQLDVTAAPRTFPVVGRAVARRHEGTAPAPPRLSLGAWAWGGERIEVPRLVVPAHLLGKPLLLTVGEQGRYRLTADDSLALDGSVGQNAADAQAGVEVLISEIVARPGTQFFLVKRDRDRTIDALKAELRVQEKGRRSGIISISTEGSDAKRVAAIVNGVATAYLRQNVEGKSAEAAKTLEFLETQIPKVKANVDAAEAALNAFRVRSGTVDATAETRSMLERLAQLDREIGEAEARRADLQQAFTGKHPNLVANANRIALLRSERAQLGGKMRSLPEAELNSARLARELRDSTELYVSLLNRAQELRVAKSGTVADVRIIDQAIVPDEPASPKTGATLVLALMAGLSFGVAGAILRKSWVKRAETPDDVEEATGVPVYATVPHSDAEAESSRTTRRKRRVANPLLAESAPTDVAVEAMRSLRTSLQFALVEAPNNVVVLTGPAPGVGKSFIALNLAHVLAAAGSRVLLVDCDLRRGHLHRQFGFDRKPGLSDVVSGDVSLAEAVRTTPSAGLCVLPTGRIPPNPAELLSSQRFESLLKDASSRFDLVIVDTPPLLAVTDAMLVTRFAGVNFLVLRAGKHTGHELAATVKQFALGSIKLHGTVLNDVFAAPGARYGRGGYVHYQYSSDSE